MLREKEIVAICLVDEILVPAASAFTGLLFVR